MFPQPDSPPLASLMLPPTGEGRRLARGYASAVGAMAGALMIRPESPPDLDFQHALYASTRMAEMALIDWPAADKQAFLLQQSSAQLLHYRQHYPDAAFLVCEQAGKSIGRVYLSPVADELRLMDIALLPEHRGRGLGRILMAAVIEVARKDDMPVGLHVEPNNPAAAWYRRLGFEQVAEVGVYRFMRLSSAELSHAQEKLIS
jgi:ribosomal protein S18 acetylase RimI-like enzyme